MPNSQDRQAERRRQRLTVAASPDPLDVARLKEELDKLSPHDDTQVFITSDG